MSIIREISPNVTHIDNQRIESEEVSEILQTSLTKVSRKFVGDSVVTIIDVATGYQIQDYIKEAFEDYSKEGALYSVSVTGHPDAGSSEGSKRFCTMSRKFSDLLHYLIVKSNGFPLYSKAGEFIGVSPYLRFMKYSPGGEHFPHLDSDWAYSYDPEGRVVYTKYSLVMYFTNNDTGELAFVENALGHGNDWERQAREEEILLKVKPRAGRIVLFPHNLCHSVLPFEGPGERIMVRGDVEFDQGSIISRGKYDF